MEYGHFDDHNREYVITNARTPVKWINYIGTLAFGGFVDQTGGALLCKGDPALDRITKYIPQLPSSSFKGTTLYIRFREGDGYRVFSPYYVPTLDNYDHYQCRVGLGYTRIISEFYHVRTDVTIFVPLGGRQEIRDIRITNLSDQPLEIDVIPVVEYTHPDALRQFTNADWIPQTMQSQVVSEPDGHKILLQYPFMLKEMRVNYLTSNRPVSSFESDRPRFLGDHEYGTWATPRSLQQPELSSYEARRGDNVGALLHHLGEIGPGATQQLITQLGQGENIKAALDEIRRYREPAQVQAARDELRWFWDGILARQQVRTPDPDMDRMLNIHNPRQCYVTKQWSRYLSLYQLGLGARGIGFRDSSQDVMGVVPLVPEEAKALIEMLLQVQKRDGSAMHQFNPLTMIGNEGDLRHEEERPKYYSDDHLWIVLAVTTYLKETGDLDFLEQVIPFYDKDRDESPIEAGTVLEHLQRALAFTRENVGRHKLPLAGFADWNDTVNLLAGAESLFTANLYGTALREMIQLVGHLGDGGTADRYRAWYDEMRDRVNAEAWDGGWYVRYFDADGSPIGSHTNQEGQIFANGQSWPVISGFATPERARMALDAVYARLNTRNGIKLSAPGYDGFDPLKGGVTTYPPGAKENGGIFLHANPWVIIAETILGEGDRAFEVYEQMNPAAKNDRIDEFECEPYVYPQNILGDEHPQFGLARNSWLTGTASWAYQAATKHILGIRPTHAGLEVDPCIPAGWDGFSVTREFRGATYEIQVRNPAHVCRGVRRLRVDGEKVRGNCIPLFGDGQVHQVEVVLEE
jgi:cellobiose phosphorylase